MSRFSYTPDLQSLTPGMMSSLISHHKQKKSNTLYLNPLFTTSAAGDNELQVTNALIAKIQQQPLTTAAEEDLDYFVQ